jgi:hypothetical protein
MRRRMTRLVTIVRAVPLSTKRPTSRWLAPGGGSTVPAGATSSPLGTISSPALLRIPSVTPAAQGRGAPLSRRSC